MTTNFMCPLNYYEIKRDNFAKKIEQLGIEIQFNSKKVPKTVNLNHYNSKKYDIPKNKVHLMIYSKERDFKNLFFEYSLESGASITYKAICMIPINIVRKFYNNELQQEYSKYFSKVHFEKAKDLINDVNMEEGYYVGLITGDKENLYDIQIFPSETVKTYDSGILETAKRCLKEEMGLRDKIENIMIVKEINKGKSSVIFELI